MKPATACLTRALGPTTYRRYDGRVDGMCPSAQFVRKLWFGELPRASNK